MNNNLYAQLKHYRRYVSSRKYR